MALSYLILGSNSTNKDVLLGRAIAHLQQELGKVIALSSIYETEAWGYESTNSYLNQLVSIETQHSPKETLHITQEIEKKLGRTTKSVGGKYTDRPIDIDILFYDNKVINLPDLTIPHPHIAERRFVLEPLQELAADLIHPIQQVSITQLLNECDDILEVKKL